MGKNADLTGKKLLILGANQETVLIIETARQMGIYTIVTDYVPNAYAKKFADKSYDVDGLDIDGLVELARKEQIDGIMVGVADRLISPYQQLCKRLNVPCYATSQQCEVLTDKENFNKVCARYGISGIPSYQLDGYSDKELYNDLHFPIMIKPVDSSSGKGMMICNSPDEIKPAIEKAIRYSQSGRFLVERFMQCDDISITYTIKNEEIFVSAVADRFTCRQQKSGSPVCLGNLYPSKYTNLYFDTLHDKFLHLFKDIRISNGVLMISAFVENNNIYVYDPGFRLQGEAPNLHIEAVNGFDQKKLLIEFALTGNMGKEDLYILNDVRFHNKHTATIWSLIKEGTIAKIEGLEELQSMPEVFKINQRLYEHDIITPEMIGTERQVLARVYLMCDTFDQLKGKVREFQKIIKVYNDKGENLVLPGFEP